MLDLGVVFDMLFNDIKDTTKLASISFRAKFGAFSKILLVDAEFEGKLSLAGRIGVVRQTVFLLVYDADRSSPVISLRI